MGNNQYETELSSWISKEKSAIELINIVGQLAYEKSVELIIFRKQLLNASPGEILKHHLYARNIIQKEITIDLTLALSIAITKIEVAPSRIDLGRLCNEWYNEASNYNNDHDAFVADKLKDCVGLEKMDLKPRDVVLYGFGRIGRLAARELINQAGNGNQLRFRAIVTRSTSPEDIKKRADLLRNDSIHGPFKGTIVEDIENQALIINGQTVKMLAAKSPTDIDYTEYGISNALVIDNTGAWRDREGLGQHLKAKGIGQVLLTAPGKDDIPNIVYGVNDHEMKKDETILSAASCTTNAISPVLKIIKEQYGIISGHIETVHAYTNDQNLADNFHSKSRRGRAAAMNMVITETGAAKAVSKVLPELAGILTGNAVRVPTPDVSLAILHLNLKKESSLEEINASLKSASLFGNMVDQIEFSISNELVSTDIVGNSHASVVDGPATIMANDKKSVVLYVWYDNEYGYTRQVIRVAKKASGVRRLRYY
ncbi:MAG: glyceraldehyde 3-phosphate dehydrogenase [Sphingobacteriales bacterium]|jgi:glyceraldehyde 3-phosphate dehydrogenase